jgi:short-subunit dehydrogenase
MMVSNSILNYVEESAIVIDSTKGIGRGNAEKLVDTGENIVLIVRSGKDVRSVAKKLNERGSGQIICVAANILDTPEM